MQSQRISGWSPRPQMRKSSLDSKYSFPPEEKLALLEALDHLYITKHYQETGSCPVCKKISTKRCSACSTYYCSSDCQNADWQKHKSVCNKKDVGFEFNNVSKQTECKSPPGNKIVKDALTEEKLMLKSSGSPFTALANQLKKNVYAPLTSAPNANRGSDRERPARNDVRYSMGGGVRHEKKIPSSGARPLRNKKPFNGRRSIPDNNGEVSDIKSITNNSRENSFTQPKVCETVQNSNGNFLKVKKKEVIGIYRESEDRYWVMEVKNASKYQEIQTTLANECDGYESISPMTGLVCGCNFSDEWFRGKILSTSPVISVHYIDYGNVSNYDFDLVKKLPDEMRSLPGLVFLIEFEKGTPSEYSTEDLDTLQFTVEETGETSDGVSIVKIIDGAPELASKSEKVGATPEKQKKVQESRERTVMDTITATSKGLLFLLPGDGRVRFGSLVPDGNESASICMEEVLSLSESDLSPVVAKEGNYVLVCEKAQQVNVARGKIVSKTESAYYVRLLDCGNVILVKDVYPISERLMKLIELGVKITVEVVLSKEKMKDLEACSFRVIGEAKSGRWPCHLVGETQNEIIAKVLIEKPPVSLEMEWKVAHLKSGSTVEISAITSNNHFYIRSVDAEVEQKFMEMNTEMIEFASKAESFNFPPEPHILCCAKFKEDECYYRAIVTSVGTGKVTVLFVDFGNEQETDLRDVKPIPFSLKDVPCFAVKVSLKGVSGKPWNNIVRDYFKKLITENVEFTLNYEGSISDGVTLREKRTGVILNEFMENATEERGEAVFPLQAVPPSSKRPVGGIFLDTDLVYTTIPPGSDCELIVLYVDEEEFEGNHTFWATLVKNKNFDYVNGELQEAITDYCSKTSRPYRPSVREVCLAEFEGFWYRAICVSNDGIIFKVFFLDFGNVSELKAEFIRNIKKEFIEAPALAMNCAVTDRERFKGKPELTRRVLTFLQDRVHTCFEGVTITKFTNNTFSVKIKEIEAILSA